MTAGRAPTGGSAARAANREARSRWNSRWVVAAVLLAIAVVFVVENRQLTEIRLLVPVVLMPLWAALAGTLLIGLVIGVLLDRQRRR
jgi:uncharacterized integral membrane protein